MEIIKRTRSGLEDSWVRYFLRCLAVILFTGAVAHFAGIAGLVGDLRLTNPSPSELPIR